MEREAEYIKDFKEEKSVRPFYTGGSYNRKVGAKSVVYGFS
jgi:hypothetical protein